MEPKGYRDAFLAVWQAESEVPGAEEPQEQAPQPEGLLQSAWSTLTSMFVPQARCEVEPLAWQETQPQEPPAQPSGTVEEAEEAGLSYFAWPFCRETKSLANPLDRIWCTNNIHIS